MKERGASIKLAEKLPLLSGNWFDWWQLVLWYILRAHSYGVYRQEHERSHQWRLLQRQCDARRCADHASRTKLPT